MLLDGPAVLGHISAQLAGVGHAGEIQGLLLEYRHILELLRALGGGVRGLPAAGRVGREGKQHGGQEKEAKNSRDLHLFHGNPFLLLHNVYSDLRLI